MSDDKKKAIKWIKIKKEIDRLQKIKDEEYRKWCKKRETYGNKYHRTMDALQKPIDKLYDKFKKVGIIPDCEDYGG
jgi:hypothetical protein